MQLGIAPVHVEVPRSVVGIFTIRPSGGKPPRAPLARAAEVLGYKDAESLRNTVSQWWTGWHAEDSLSAAELVALIHILQFKTAAAGGLAKELMLGGTCKTVSLPSEALGGLPEDEVSGDRPDEELRSDIASAADAPSRMESGRELCTRLREPPWDSCDPEDVGMDREPLERCRRYLSYRVGRRHFAGIAQGVVKNGKLVHYNEVGYADVASKTPMRQDTLIRLFSMTKCIVVVAFLRYAEDPAYNIDIDDPVWKWIPSFKKAVIAPKRGADKPRQIDSKFFEEKSADGKAKKAKLPTQPTLRQLLTHTAGLGYGPTLGDNLPPTDKDHYKIYFDLVERAHKGEIKTIEEWVDELAKVPLKVHPGSYWEYSFAIDVLGRVVEVISGKPLDEAVEEKVCGPLGMVDTSFKVPPEKAHRLGSWYEKKPPVDEKGNPLEKVPSGATYNLEVLDKGGSESGWFCDNVSSILSGGGTIEVPLSIKGGMVSTFRDYLRFLMMIRNLGELDGLRILRKETVQTMICNQIPAATGRKAAWVFDRKGQAYNFIGQIQVQHHEKDTYQEKGELKRGNQTYASLAPGTVSSEFGWGGLGGPAFTIDLRADLIVLSMTQTALELDHEENLRFSARRAIHAGIFGETAGPAKVTDYPTEFHEAKRGGGKLWPASVEQRKGPLVKSVKLAPVTEAELQAFMEAEELASMRPKTLKEISITRGNAGHEVTDDDDDADVDGSNSLPLSPGPDDPSGGASAPDVSATEAATATQQRVLRQSISASSEDKVPAKREHPADGEQVERKTKQAKSSKREDGGSSPIEQGETSPSSKDMALFARVSVRADPDDAKVSKARITGIEGDMLEVITEGKYQTLNVGIGDVSMIDETQFVASTAADVRKGPSDFSFLLPGGEKQKDNKTPKKGITSTPTKST